jgi:DNA-binding NtrC family response regulator
MDTEAASQQERTAPVVTVLIVLGNATSCLASLLRHSNWNIQTASGFEDAAGRLQTAVPPVVVAPYRSNSALGWINLLERLMECRPAPRLILTDPHMNESIWAEALNLGAYDVLVQPFDPCEVFRVLTAAWQSWWYDSLRDRGSSNSNRRSRIARPGDAGHR